jgi:hypothetical protein
MKRRILLAIALMLGLAANASAGVSEVCENANGALQASPVTVTLCATPVSGDLIRVDAYADGTSAPTFTVPADYSQLGSTIALGGSGAIASFYYVVGICVGSCPSTVLIEDNGGGSNERSWITRIYSGENTTTPFDPGTTSQPGSLTTDILTLSGLTTTNSPDMLSVFAAQDTSGGGTPTVSYSSPLSQTKTWQLSASWQSFFAADGLLSSSGATGNQTLTFSAEPSEAVGIMAAIEPATALSGSLVF